MNPRITSLFVICTLVLGSVSLAAVRGEEVMYVGGTITDIPERTKGRLDRKDKALLRFTSPKGNIEIPYDEMTSLEYGQKAGRRLGVALIVTPWALFSKKRKHFVTIGYNDANGDPQGVVFEIGKKHTKVYLITIEARSGLRCDYESEEARKHVHG